MIHYAFMDATGVYPRQAGDAKSLPAGAVEAPFKSDWLKDMMLVAGVWTDRPRIAEPVIDNTIGVAVRFAALPVGTTCRITDMETGEVLDCRPMWARYDEARRAPARSS